MIKLVLTGCYTSYRPKDRTRHRYLGSPLPLQQRAALLLNQRFDHPQALHITSVFVNFHALGQRLLRRIEVVAAYCQVFPRLFFLVGATEREVGFHLEVWWQIGGEEELQERSGYGAGLFVACESLVVVSCGFVGWDGRCWLLTSWNCWPKAAIASLIMVVVVVIFLECCLFVAI